MALEIAACILHCCKDLFFDLCYPTLKDIINLKENKENLSNQLEYLIILKTTIMKYIEDGKRKMMIPSGEVEYVLQRIQRVEQDYREILAKFEAKTSVVQGHCGNCKLLLELSQQVANTIREMKTVCKTSENYMEGRGVVVDRPPDPAPMVEELLVPPLYGRQEVINRIMNHLSDDRIRIIGLWGITGVGKTTVAQKVNNLLIGKETRVIYVPMKDMPGIEGIQNQIARRLGMTFGEHDTNEARGAALSSRLRDIKFLLILDDVRTELDLNVVGVPNRSGESIRSKVLLTTTNKEVCNQMASESDAIVEVSTLAKDDAWSLFVNTVGKVMERREIRELAKKLVGECEGLPKYLIETGKRMKGKPETWKWRNEGREMEAWRLTRCPSDLCKADIEQTLRDQCNRSLGRDYKPYFFYCGLFSRRSDVDVKRLISYWRAEGFMEELNSMASTDKGFDIIEKFRGLSLLNAEDSSDSVMTLGMVHKLERRMEDEEGHDISPLRESPSLGRVTMRGLVRGVALKMAEEEGYKFFVRDEETRPVSQWPTEGMIPQDTKRISLMGHKIEALADQPRQEWSELSTLILQRNPLKSISDVFFHGMPALKVLDLSHTQITTLPPSVSTLVNAEALYLGGCLCLSKMPPIGGLRRLQFLDLSLTQIEELPQGLEELSQLKTLILSHTKSLTSIRRGLMPCLSAIEELDMHQSAYSWGLEGMGKFETATLEELRSLQKLEALSVNIKNPTCLIPNEFGEQWRRLWQFSFRIGTGIDVERRPDRELHVIDSDGLLPSESVKMVLSRIQSLVLFQCTGIEWISQVGGSLKDLKSLFVNSCDDVSSLVITRDDVDQDGAWEELEILDLRNLANLETIWMGRAPRGGTLGNLTHITISCCPQLRSLFPIGVFGKENKLKEIHVLGCASIEEVFQGEVIEARAGGDSEIEEEACLPCLRRVILKDLPRLTVVCKEEACLPFLEEVEVKSCPLLTNLPILDIGEIRQIKGSKIWWEQLKWQNESIKTDLQRLFCDNGE